MPDPPEDASRPPEPDADPASVARALCLRLLDARPYTRAGLATELRRRGVPDDAAAAVLDRFADVRLVDDAAYAASYVESQQRRRGLSRRALATELRRKGVQDDDVSEAVAAVSDDDERALAEALVARKLAGMRGVPPERRAARLVGMLARKGYGSGLAYAVVRAALAGAGEPEVAEDP